MRKVSLLILFLLAELPGFSQTDSSQTAPDTVKIGAYVISVHDINFREKEFTVRFWLWFIYDNPEFDFTSQLDIPNAKTIDKPEVILDSVDGKAWVMLKMKCIMKKQWTVEDFPFDTQHLTIHIENAVFDNSKLIFAPDIEGSTFDKELTLEGWDINRFTVNTTVNDYETAFGAAADQYSEYASFNIEMDIERNAWGLFAKIFIGMYIAFLISMLSFTPHPSELEPRFGLPVGGLFAAVGNKYIIDSLLPETTSFSLVDTLHAITFFIIFATLVVSAITLKLYDHGKNDLCDKVNKIGSRLVVLFYVIVNIVLVSIAAW
ncbi:MAG: hypothetical protein L0Y35_04775 [Flammeovirgaceae bacterium]|nr:hypothetical protein [Flammeovirgaceae bacterium]